MQNETELVERVRKGGNITVGALEALLFEYEPPERLETVRKLMGLHSVRGLKAIWEANKKSQSRLSNRRQRVDLLRWTRFSRPDWRIRKKRILTRLDQQLDAYHECEVDACTAWLLKKIDTEEKPFPLFKSTD